MTSKKDKEDAKRKRLAPPPRSSFRPAPMQAGMMSGGRVYESDPHMSAGGFEPNIADSAKNLIDSLRDFLKDVKNQLTSIFR